MPRALQIDWPLVQARYVTGSLPKQLAEDFGVSVSAIQKRAVRGKWSRLRTATRQNVATMVEKAVQMTLEQKSDHVKERLADELVRQTRTLEVVPAKNNLDDLSARSELASTVARAANTVFRWDDQPAVKPLVNVLLLGGGYTPPEEIIPVDQDFDRTPKPIDVASSPQSKPANGA